MLKLHQWFLIKKGIKTILTDPISFYYKFKHFKKSLANVKRLNHESVNLIDKYTLPQINFIPEIIIPIYNGYDYLKQLLAQLLSHTHIQYHLILINDCSTDERIAVYLNQLKQLNILHIISILTNSENQGFIKTVNYGMSLTENHFIILNTDTEVPTFFANKILTPIIEDNLVASVTPFTNSGTICSFPDFCQDNEIFLGLDVDTIDKVFSDVDSTQHNIEIPTGVGFCMAINKLVYNQIGAFDADTFGMGYAEENDWCMRAKNAGYINIIASNCFVYHKHGGSFTTEQKQRYLKNNYKQLLKKHPNYASLVTKFVATDPLSDLRVIMMLKIITNENSVVCVFNTVHSGGAKAYLAHLIVDYHAISKQIIVIEAKDFLAKVRLEVYVGNAKFEFQVANIFDLLKKLKLEEIMINHLLFNSELAKVCAAIIDLKNILKAKLQIIIHDYFYICPSINLLSYDNKYCGVPEQILCNKCFKSFNNRSIGSEYMSLYKNRFDSTATWRQIFMPLLASANTIVAPSKYVKDLYSRVYPGFVDKVIVRDHNLKYLATISNRLNYKPFGKDYITIATIGDIKRHKGSNILKNMLKMKTNFDIRWLVIGDCDLPLKPNYRKLKIHKNYKVTELNELINKYKPDLFVVTSIWPETFCYTASEMMHFNLPVISFNIGAHAQRVASYANGYIVDEISASSMFSAILKVINNYFVSK